MDTEQNARESRLRRQLAKAGHRLAKTPSRSWLRAHYGPGYMIFEGNTVIFGGIQHQYDATLEEVEEWAKDMLAKLLVE